MAPIRTTNRITSRITFAVTGAAVALAATATGAAAFSAGATNSPTRSASAVYSPAHPATTARIIAAPGATRPGSSRAGAHQAGAATLDGSARPLLLASSRHHHRTPRQKARRMLRRKGWSSSYQFPYLNRLWDRESSWNVHADNPYSGAYGIPQAVPGSKMESAGPDWQSSAGTQIRWGLNYIRARYNSPRRAWFHEESDGWY